MSLIKTMLFDYMRTVSQLGRSHRQCLSVLNRQGLPRTDGGIRSFGSLCWLFVCGTQHMIAFNEVFTISPAWCSMLDIRSEIVIMFYIMFLDLIRS